jgi:hypothetical protein
MMKKLQMILVAMMVTFFSYAQQLQDQDVPAAVTAAVVAKYPEAKQIKWSMDSTGTNYIADFKLKEDKYNYSLLLQSGGNIIRTEHDIEVTELPQAIIDYLNTNYPKVQINKAKRTDIIIDNRGTVLYTVELQNKVQPLVFDSNGTLQ